MNPFDRALLAQILSENEPVVGDLVKQVRGEGVVPFIGAGLSKPFGLPLWGEFLRCLVTQVGHGDSRIRLKALIDKWKYEEAAEELEAELKPFFLFDKSRFLFRTPPNFNPVGQAISFIPAIGKRLVITTNYDRLLETTFARFNCPLAVVRGQDFAELERLIQQGAACLWKMHGDLDDPDKRTLTFSEYERNYKQAGQQHLTSIRSIGGVLMELSARYSLLFIGCSLQEDRTTKMLRKVGKFLPAPRHYALLQDPGEHVRADRAKELGAMRIRPIWYPPDPDDAKEKHRGNRVFLAYLARQIYQWPRTAVRLHFACAKVGISVALVAIFIERLVPGSRPGTFHGGIKVITLTLLLLFGTTFALSGWHILRRAGRLPTWWNSRLTDNQSLHISPGRQAAARLAIFAFFFPLLWTYGHFLHLIFTESAIYRYGDRNWPPLHRWGLFSFPSQWWDPAAWRWDDPNIGFSAFPGIQMWVYAVGFFVLLLVALLLIGSILLPPDGCVAQSLSRRST